MNQTVDSGPREVVVSRTKPSELSHDLGAHEPRMFPKVPVVKKRTQSPACSHCSAEVDDAEHTIFVCPFWDETRYELSQLLRRKPRPEDVADMLCRPIIEKLPTDPIQRRRIQKAASRVASTLSQMVECIMGRKEELERIRQCVPLAAAAAN